MAHSEILGMYVLCFNKLFFPHASWFFWSEKFEKNYSKITDKKNEGQYFTRSVKQNEKSNDNIFLKK